MTKSMRILLPGFYAILLSTSFSNCSKDGNDKPVTKTDLLTNQLWKIEKSGVDADKNNTIDLLDTWQPCELDNTFLFKSDGSGTFDEGATKCNATDAQNSSFTWTFKNEETILSGVIPALGFSGDAIISTLNETTIEVYQDVTIAATPVRYIIRLKH